MDIYSTCISLFNIHIACINYYDCMIFCIEVLCSWHKYSRKLPNNIHVRTILYLPERETCPLPELFAGNDGLFMSIPNKSLHKKKTKTTNNKQINANS